MADSNHLGNFGLLRISADGSNLIQLTKGTFDGIPSCSPDGKWVVFQSKRTGGWTLWKMSVNGGKQTQLTSEEMGNATISPDGKLIACVYWPPNKPESSLAILPFEGGAFAKMFEWKDGTEYLQEVRWTPDGQNLTYPVYDGNLWNQPVAGGPPRQITNFQTGDIFSFAWSRDGKRLAVVRGSRSSDVVMISNLKSRE